jgi:hypothetical protein
VLKKNPISCARIFTLFAFMIILIITLGGTSCIYLESCSKKEGTAEVTIISQPKGGNWVQSVNCTVRATISDLLNPVDVTAEWMTSNGSHAKETWRIDTVSSQRTTSFSAPSGKYLDKPFWLRVSWSDANGRHEIQSEKADCRTP